MALEPVDLRDFPELPPALLLLRSGTKAGRWSPGRVDDPDTSDWTDTDWLPEDEEPQTMADVRARQIAKKFAALKAEWKSRTAHLSSLDHRFADAAYHRIIFLGKDVLPILLKELRDDPDYWFPALFAITDGQEAVKEEHYGNLRLMADDWLEWARAHGVELAE